jgi:hypothetical protein
LRKSYITSALQDIEDGTELHLVGLRLAAEFFGRFGSHSGPETRERFSAAVSELFKEWVSIL